MAIVLDAGRAKAGKPVLVDGLLPAEKFLDREGISLASLLEAQKPSADGRHHLCLAADHPAPRVRRWKIGDGQGAAIRADNILDPRTVGLGHDTLTHTLD